MHAAQVDTTGAGDAASQGHSDLPAGDLVRLPGRGSVFVRQLPGPRDAPTLVLLHGWTVTADVTWHLSYQTLGRHFRVIAFDHRGHGRGLRGDAGFQLEHCADDVAAVATELGIDRFIPVGYSMGGPVVQLLWRGQHSRNAGNSTQYGAKGRIVELLRCEFAGVEAHPD